MFAEDTNLFFYVNVELEKIKQWSKINKLSLNIKKTKCTLFMKNLLKMVYH